MKNILIVTAIAVGLLGVAGPNTWTINLIWVKGSWCV